MWGNNAGNSGNDDLLNPDAAHEQIARWRERVDRMAIDTNAMSDRLRDARMSAADRDGMVEVTIDATGKLVALRLSDRIQRVPPDEVAKTVMRTIAVASKQLGEVTRQIITDTMGADSPVAQEIAERVGRQLSPPEPPANDGGGDPSRRR